MRRVLLDLPADVHQHLLAHLLPAEPESEQAAFVLARAEQEGEYLVLRYADWIPIGPDGVIHASGYYLELTDEMRGTIIKRGHDLGASLVEFHSHLGPWPAAFSPSDRAGFLEFVPHVWWRLKGRPYAAVVVADSGFDGLAWLTGPRTPQALSGIRAGGRLLLPSGLTLQHWSEDER